MERKLVFANLILILLVLSGGWSPIVEQDKPFPKVRQVDIDYFSRIYESELSEYSSWQLMPGTTEKMKGYGPHLGHVTVYVNAIALDAIQKNADSLPEGAAIVKEAFRTTADAEPVALLMMRKRYGEWFWAGGLHKNIPERKIAAGFGWPGERMEGCADCHQRADRDQVILWKQAEKNTGN